MTHPLDALAVRAIIRFAFVVRLLRSWLMSSKIKHVTFLVIYLDNGGKLCEVPVHARLSRKRHEHIIRREIMEDHLALGHQVLRIENRLV